MRIYFDSDAKTFWFKKARVVAWLRDPQALQALGPQGPGQGPPGPPTPAPSAPHGEHGGHGEHTSEGSEESEGGEGGEMQISDGQIEEIEEFEIRASAQPLQQHTCRVCQYAWHAVCLPPPRRLLPCETASQTHAWLCDACERAQTRAIAADWE